MTMILDQVIPNKTLEERVSTLEKLVDALLSKQEIIFTDTDRVVISKDKLLSVIETHYGISIEDLKGKSLDRGIATIRKIVSNLLFNEGYSMHKISKLINKSYGTIRLYITSFNDSYKYDSNFRTTYNTIINLLKE